MLKKSLLATMMLAALALAGIVRPATAPAEEAAMSGGMKGDLIHWIQDAEGKLEQLAEAMPEGKYAWRPGKDVRSVGEVYMHVATANLGVPSFWGVTPPAGFDFNTYEKSLTKKADIQKALKDSFAHMEAAISSLSDADMEKPLELMGMKTTVRGGCFLLLTHVHEHLGQSIAYARMNGVVPPWSAAQQAEMKKTTEKMKSGGK